MEQNLEIVNFVVEADAAIGVHGGDPVEVPAGLTEASEVGSVQKPYLEAYFRDQWAGLDLVEHVLVVLARIYGPGLVPKLVEFDCFGI